MENVVKGHGRSFLRDGRVCKKNRKALMNADNRKLMDHELRLLRWMLEHDGPEAAAFLAQLDRVEVTPWKCACGCASLCFQIGDSAEPTAGIRTLAEFTFGEGDTVSGIFVCEKDGILSGVDVYALAGESPKSLPRPEELRPLGPFASP